ncbi:winged helix-turn-helix domain-containing protein [Halogeometricum limi]|uniref:Winged helix-turn-helix DNA-binding n=1 Tax=Halogeometricum limi TaxID=555875 RepID=A0A1I6IUB3_9EURY|nr:winged helix-turn-helix domain-containing protein [Halogeometricum limi]SFR70241.1 Winged helix-turn-helix DNA-binding [Halogeometricum limi]
MTEEVPGSLREMPPSSKLVYKVLEHDGPLTQRQLADNSLLPTRTVRYALDRLRDADIVEERLCIQDARKRLYYLAEDDRVQSADVLPLSD